MSIKPGFLFTTLPILFAAAIFTSWIKRSPVKEEVRWSAWGKALIEKRLELEGKATNEESTREDLEEFAREYPFVVDWLHQDHGLHWETYFTSTDATRDLSIVTKVFSDIQRLGGTTGDLEHEWESASKAGIESKVEVYLNACKKRRGLRLANLLAKQTSVVFAQHHNFIMSFIGYTEGLSDARHERFFKPGSRLVQLNFEALFAQPKVLIDDAYGMIRDVEVSDDGKRLLFAWKKSDRLDDYHIYEYNLVNDEIRQLTHGLGRADYEPVYLPDGDIIFTSTRPEQSVPCWWTEISNLYRMNADGQYLRRLAIDQVHTLYPQLLDNGKVIYTRWDYSDRGQNYPHPLFSMNPDGTDQRVYYGGNSWFPTSLLHARTIPGTSKVMAIAAGHHTRQHGKVVVLDITRGRDEGQGMEFVAPRREVPYERVDVAQQTGDQFRYPYPINEQEFLVSYVPEKPGAENPKYADNAVYGLYWMDLDGNRELLYLDPELSIGRPVPLDKPLRPGIIPDTVDYRQNTGIYYVHDVYDGIGLKGIERGTAKKIRVVRLNYRAAGVGQSRNEGEGGRSLNSSPVAIGNGSWDIKEILGDVDIEADGSALFEVPAMQSIYLQVIDKKGRVIQNTRSWDTVRPGEKKACRGCHSKENANYYDFKQENTLAWQRSPQSLQPFYGESRGFSFVKEIQPILDEHCIQCHNGQKEGVMSLLGDQKSHGTLEKRTWSESYLNLTHAEKGKRNEETFYAGNPENEVVNWISKMSKPTELDPYSYGAATSKMMKMLEDGHYEVQLSDEAYHKLAAWLDLLVPFVGEYREANDWTDEEMAYYNYYEYKRGRHKSEEMDAIKAWLERKENNRITHPVKNLAKNPAATGYQEIPADIKITGTSAIVAFVEEKMIDRIDLVFSEESAGTECTLAFSGGRMQTFELKVIDGQSTINLAKPLKVDLISIKGQIPLRAVRCLGVSLQEIPGYQSHQPYLQLDD